jgi:ABC-type multidrug transport system fused ATPase/permease subunit
MKWYDNWKDFDYKNWKIEIENLTYWYSENKPVFKNFDLKLKWWKITAFVGNSWSWKSTLVKLIAGYIRADSWEVIIDEQKLNKIKLKSYYKNIWYLTQDPSVFDGSILDNLMYWAHSQPLPCKEGSRDVWQKHLDKIIKQSKCEFIYDLEDWINTEIWERWVRLSWGQKQRLAIAKIFLKDPKIIILDEPTSALDSFSEEQITYAMHNLFKWRTVIIIAHRLQTVKDANDIILFENGEIKERWTHKELVKIKGQYNKMLELQSGF